MPSNDNQQVSSASGLEVAVIGIALRVPQALDAEQFWQHLAAGRELIKVFSREELLAAGVSESELDHPAYVRASACLDAPLRFDAEFFGYSAREAEYMDPQLRLLHECCWEALEAAGCDPLLHERPIGLYAGTAQNLHWLKAVAQHVGGDLGEVYDLKMLYQREFFSTRIAYRLNLQGPALMLDTTCSTSLVAVHMAMQGLLSGDCDIALAGGACVSPLVKGYRYHEGMIQSPDGHCRPFDAQAKGTVPGQGVGVVALKRLEDALAAGDPIHAVLRASAINNDGNDKVGYTAPSVSGQSRVIRAALDLAQLSADDIDFVECHGTATRVGDPIEVAALEQAYGTGSRATRCLLGSVKSNLGHLDTAAGIMGLIKAVLSVRHGVLPASLHYTAANPMIDFAKGSFAVNAAATPLAHGDRPVRGAVSSFGIGGTNAHVIVEQFCETRRMLPSARRYHLVPLSARSAPALERHASSLHARLAAGALPLDAIAATLQARRRHFAVRRALVAADTADLQQQLGTFAPAVPAPAKPRVVFMFPGQGAQYAGMGAALYEHEPRYRRVVDECLQLLEPRLAAQLREVLFAAPATGLEELAARTEIAQPLLFIVSYALARTLLELGVQPSAMLGHSLGEYVAACLANVFSVADALHVVCERGRLMGAASAGAMLAVQLSAEQVQPWLAAGVELAADNSTGLVVLSGERAALAQVRADFEPRGIASTWLKTSHAYHSQSMAQAVPALHRTLDSVELRAPQLSFIANRTGLPVTAQQATDPEYWCQHLRGTVRFRESLATLLGEEPALLIELGPGNALSTFATSHAAWHQRHRCVQSMRHPKQQLADDLQFCRLLAALYEAGVLEPAALAAEFSGPYLSLPAYAFEPTVYEQVAGRRAALQPDRSLPAAVPEVREICHPRPQLTVPYIAAASATEQRLCELWRGIFKLEAVGVDDNFFELGGHSLLATRLLGAVREQLASDVSLQMLFEQPTVRGLATCVLAGADGLRRPLLVRVSRDALLPTSFQQRRLWIIDKLSSGSAQYNMPAPFILRGALDLAAVQHALDTLVARHEALRTHFQEVDGEPFQVIRAPQSLQLQRLDLSDLSAVAQLERRQALVREDALRPFDLAQDPLIRVTLVKLAEQVHLMLFNVHHIVSDGWSEMVIVREFRELYAAQCSGRAPRLPELPLQYADYAAWQRNWLRGEALEAELEFWRTRLDGIPAVHQLPLDRPRPKVARYRGALLRKQMPQALLQQLKEFAQARAATLFMALQSAFALLLARWSNTEDMVMGTPIAGREHSQLEPLAGFFVNTLLLRNDLSGSPSFETLLQRTRAMALSAFEHQHVPVEMLVDALAPSRSQSHAPLFQILFALQNYERSAFELEGLELERVEATVAARFDLTLITAESSDGLFADWYYDTDLFDAATIERMAQQYQLLIEALLERPAQNAFALPVVTAAERTTLLEEWQHWSKFHYDGQHVLDWFSAQAARQPAAPALRDAHHALSYGELEAASSRLAQCLVARGIQPNDLVAVCAAPSVELIVALFAVLKCGAGYLPLDPKYPTQRLTYMLSDSGAATLIVDRAQHAQAVDWRGVLLDLSAPELQQELTQRAALAPELPRDASTGENPAYVIYTSGSTGKPKGTLIRQKQLIASLVSRFASFPEPVGCGVLTSSISFDSSVPLIYWSLSTGGVLYLTSEQERRDPAALAEVLDRLQATHLVCLPAFYGALLDTFDGERWRGASLQVVILAGEAFPPELIGKHFAHPQVRSALYNEYGPTECSVWSTVYRCRPGAELRNVPIGHGPGHARLYVLNPARVLAPIGVEGELYIGGDGVSDGYWNRADLSAQRFVADPFTTHAPATMYRSGDRVRWRRDGELEFLGRIDTQVKLRGYRIELGEIEDALTRAPGVIQAVARVSEQRLVAYVCGQCAADAAQVAALRDWVAQRLPDYMVPQLIMRLDAMPLLPNGKVDASRLPALVSQHTQQRELPRTPHEQQLAALWCELLKLETVSIDQDFFALGGDSILLLKLSSRLARLDLSFTVQDFYARPSIEHLAGLLRVRARHSADQQAVSGAQLLHPMQRWFLESAAVDLHHFNQSLLLQVPATLRFAETQRIVTALHERHDVLRLCFTQDGAGRWEAVYQPLTPELIEHSLTNLRVVPSAGESQSAAVTRYAEQVQGSLSLQGPLFKVAHLQLPDGTARWLVVAHHLIVDGVSWRILLADLQQAHAQLRAGQTLALAAKTHSYQAAVQRLQQLASSEAVMRELPYWTQLLAGAEQALALVTPAAGTMAEEEHYTFVVPPAVTQAVLKDAHRAYGMTVDEVLLAALSQALLRWRGRQRCPLLLEGHGRALLEGALDVSDTVGWFTTLYPLVLENPGADAGTLLRSIKEQIRAVPAKGQHYGLLKYLAGLAQRCEDGLFQRHGITFNYLGQFAALAADADAIAVASESSGRSISPRRPRDSGIAFDGLAANGELRFTIRYDRMQLTAAEIAALAACYTAALEELVAYWSQHDLNSVTPADFPLLSVSAAELADWRQRWPSFSDAYPATPVQQGMIFHSLRDAASGAGSFVNQLFMDVDGEIDLPRLNQAWQQVIARHDVFRTAFVALEQGGVAQVVLPCAPRTWSVGFEDLAQLAAGEQQQVMARYAAEDRARGFDFAQPPLIRVALWKLADRHYCLLWTSHHAIIDGWSIPLVFRSLLQSYSAPGATVSPAPSFRDYVQWLARSERGAAKQFWREQLGQLDSACLLRRDAKGERHGVGTQLSVLERGLLEDLVRAAQSLGVTTYSLVQAAWAYVLHLYTGQRSVIFGSITSGRPAELSEADSTVGLFINTLPVVIDVDLTQSLAQWIRTIHQRHLQGQEFGHLPLVEILAQAPAGAGRLFNTALVYQNYPLEAAQRSDAQAPLRISNVRSEEATEADATVVAMPGSAGLTLKLMYSQRALSEVLSAQLLEHLARVLRVVPACVQLPLHELDAALVQPESDADLQHCSDAELQALLAEIADQTQS